MSEPSTPWRPQPPSISDPKAGDLNLAELGVEADEMEEAEADSTGDVDWTKRARESYDFSTTYVDSNYRKQWEDGLRAFNSQHAGDSKYNNPAYMKRSRIYRPKTREVIRKNEAAAASAFFSNMDRISVQATNMGEARERVSADVMKEILQYRLEKSVPWFQFLMGGIQDAQTTGVACAHIHWRFIQQDQKVLEDRPVLDLIPAENLRIDPSASWIDPVNTSPYLIHLIPMYVGDVKERMRRPDPKGRQWKEYDDAFLRRALMNDDDTTRSARLQYRQDPSQQVRNISDYNVVWVHRHIHRYRHEDVEFYTLASQYLLTDPEPLQDTVFHGERPYVIGNSIIETHKVMPSGVPSIVKQLQDEINEIANQRIDNVYLVMNKRWFVKRGKNVDIPSLMKNVAGGATMMDDTEQDVKGVDFADVTASAYMESEKLNAEFDSLIGNFSAAQVQQQRSPRESEGTMRLLQSPASILTEYMLKTYTETFVQPVLRHLVLLEQHYETDAVLLGIAGKKSKEFQKFGADRVTDEMLNRELTISVNVGMGATDPTTRLQRLAAGLMLIERMTKLPPPGVNISEVWREIFALCGYQEGDRFITEDPQIAMMQRQVQQLAMTIGQKLRNKETAERTKLQVGREKNQTTLLSKAMDHDSTSRLLLAEHILDLEKMGTEAALNPEPKGPAQ